MYSNRLTSNHSYLTLFKYFDILRLKNQSYHVTFIEWVLPNDAVLDILPVATIFLDVQYMPRESIGVYQMDSRQMP